MIRLWSIGLAERAAGARGAALPRLAQSQAANGNIEGTVRDTQRRGAARRHRHRHQHRHRRRRASSSPTSEGVYRAPLLPLGRYRSSPSCRASRSSSSRASRSRPGRPRSSTSSSSVGNVSETITVTSESPIAQPGKIDLGRTIGENESQEPAARLAQPLQLRVPAGQRHRLREQRVRRAAHQRERLADAHQLPARRQHQHREGPRRPAPAAGVGSAGPRGEGHHQRLRAGVRPDHRHGLQRDHAVGHQRPARLGELPLQAQRDVVAAVLPRADGAQAGYRGQRLHRDARRADRAGQGCTSSAPTSTSIAAWSPAAR